MIFKYKGANYSKNEYFFGPNSSNSQETGRREDEKKTPYQMFLEDDGPYSRKLYGPVKAGESDRPRQEKEKGNKLVIKNFVFRSKNNYVLERDQEALTQDWDTNQAVKKGLLWHQRDKLFSRWEKCSGELTADR